MFFFKSNRIFTLLRQKSNFISKNNQVRHFSDRMAGRNYKTISRFTNAIFASAAAIGLSLYIAKKRNIVNEAAKNIGDKEINIVANHQDHDYSVAISKCRDLLQRVKVTFYYIVINVAILLFINISFYRDNICEQYRTYKLRLLVGYVESTRRIRQIYSSVFNF